MTNTERKGILLVLSTAAISGFSIFINKYGVKEFNPYLFTWLKNSVVAFGLLGLLLGIGGIREIRGLKPRQWLLLAAIGLVGGCIPFLLFFKGLSLTSAANSSFIHKSMFVYVALLAAVFLKEKIDRRLLVAACLLLLGNVLFLKILPFGSRPGDLLIFAATLFWAVENVISKHALKTLSPRVVAFGRMGLGSIFILLFLITTGDIKAAAGLTPAHLGWIAISSAFLFGYVVTWYAGLRRVKASVATSVLLLGSPITTILTVLVGGAIALPPVQLLGMLLLIVGVVIVTKPHELVRT